MSDIEYVRHYNVWLDIQPADGHRVVMQTYPGGIHSGLDYYINAGGLIVTETTIKQTKFNPEGKPIASRSDGQCNMPTRSTKPSRLLADSSNGLYTNQWLLADIKTNEIAMFELGTDRSRLWRSSPQRMVGRHEGLLLGMQQQPRHRRAEGNGRRPVRQARQSRALSASPRQGLAGRCSTSTQGKIGRSVCLRGVRIFSAGGVSVVRREIHNFENGRTARELGAVRAAARANLGTVPRRPQEDIPMRKPLVSNDWTLIRAASTRCRQRRLNRSGRSGTRSHDDEEEELHVKFEAPASIRMARYAASENRRRHLAGRCALPNTRKSSPWKMRCAAKPRTRLCARPRPKSKPVHTTARASKEKSAAIDEPGKRRSKATPSSGTAPLSAAARDLADLALFEHESRWLAAARRLGHDVPLREMSSDPARSNGTTLPREKG